MNHLANFRNFPILLFSAFVLFAGFLPPKVLREKAIPPQRKLTVFDIPIILTQQNAIYSRSAALIGEKKYEECEDMLRKWGHQFPQDPGVPYDIACIRSLKGEIDQSFYYLEKSIRLGFGRVDHIKRDDDLTNLREDPRFQKMLELAEKTPPGKPLVNIPPPVPAKSSDGQVVLEGGNLGYHGLYQVFLGHLDSEEAGKGNPITRRKDAVGELLTQWHQEGMAAGNIGDFYDNHDADHSLMRFRDYPQLTQIEYAQPLKDRRLHYGLQNHLLFDSVVIGNSSTAQTSSVQWRSQVRHGLTIPGGAMLLAVQYRSNHLYFYPEHRDHDPGHNKSGPGGYGDVFPANAPYYVISQGSSGSDRDFMNAFAATLAAFQPETKKVLKEEGLLMPTLQMIFRRSNKMLENPEDYFSGIAHPTVFESKDINTEAMVRLANSLAADDVPPLPVLYVTEETEDKPGVDYFDVGPRQRIFDSPQSICRFHRTVQRDYRVLLKADTSDKEISKDDLEYKWVVLRGDSDRIKIIKPCADSTEVVISWHDRLPIHPGSEMESNRVDIGLFIKRKESIHWSSPAFFSITHPDNQKRIYDDDGKVLSIEYSAENYTDPRMDTPAQWTDTYKYDDKTGELLGWSRLHKGKEPELFTAEGLLVLEKESDRSPKLTTGVTYFHEEIRKGVYRIRQKNDELQFYELR